MTKGDTIIHIRLALLSLGRDPFVGPSIDEDGLTRKLKSLREEQRKIGGILNTDARREGMERAADILRDLAADNRACDHWHPDIADIYEKGEAAVRAGAVLDSEKL